MYERQPEYTQIVRGMDVYDRNGDRIGTIKEMHFGNATQSTSASATPSSTGQRNESFIAQLAKSFTSEHLPEELQERLLRRGFIRINSNGIFTSDCYALLDQIAEVGAGCVRLHVNRDELMN